MRCNYFCIWKQPTVSEKEWVLKCASFYNEAQLCLYKYTAHIYLKEKGIKMCVPL